MMGYKYLKFFRERLFVLAETGQTFFTLNKDSGVQECDATNVKLKYRSWVPKKKTIYRIRFASLPFLIYLLSLRLRFRGFFCKKKLYYQWFYRTRQV